MTNALLLAKFEQQSQDLFAITSYELLLLLFGVVLTLVVLGFFIFVFTRKSNDESGSEEQGPDDAPKQE